MRPGDQVLLSGPIGDHGITILLARGELDLEADLRSDTRSVLPLVEALVDAAGRGIRWMRDPTRGGVATSLNELARDCRLWASSSSKTHVPVHDAVRGACELLGLDPLHIANEGQFLAVVGAEYARSRRLRRCEPRLAARRPASSARFRRSRQARCSRDALRRHARHRHAGRRSAAADLLMAGRTAWPSTAPSPPTSSAACWRATQIAAAVLCARGEPPGAACREMAERFLRGGRLLAFGRGPYATDAQHVSVEFVHPVIVGKRALPALDVSCEFDAWLDAVLRPRTS